MKKPHLLKRNLPTIGLDLMGGDRLPETLLAALLPLLGQIKPPFHLVVFANATMEKELVKFKNFYKTSFPHQITPISVTDVITMEDNPLFALRTKKNSSLCIGMHLLKNKQLDALVSLGNTGALVASAKLYLKMLSGIKRPALLTLLPTQKKPIAVIDVGANVQSRVEYLLQFAKMGVAYQHCQGITKPKVGLLNIGSEMRKGRLELQEAYKKLSTNPSPNFEFKGNIEGKDVFLGEIDLLVTDGFTGNVFLKTSEGISSFILEKIDEIQKSSSSQESILEKLQAILYSTEHPGAIICGVKGIVFKCHGHANEISLLQGIKKSLELSSQNFLKKLSSQLER